MLVEDMIIKLNKLNPKLEVCIKDRDGEWVHANRVCVLDIKEFSNNEREDSYQKSYVTITER